MMRCDGGFRFLDFQFFKSDRIIGSIEIFSTGMIDRSYPRNVHRTVQYPGRFFVFSTVSVSSIFFFFFSSSGPYHTTARVRSEKFHSHNFDLHRRALG
jgi:hypothetical protein